MTLSKPQHLSSQQKKHKVMLVSEPWHSYAQRNVPRKPWQACQPHIHLDRHVSHIYNLERRCWDMQYYPNTTASSSITNRPPLHKLQSLSPDSWPQHDKQHGRHEHPQLMPSHCSIQGNEEADRTAKLSAGEKQQENKVTHTEVRTSSGLCTPGPQEICHWLSSWELVVFRVSEPD